MLRRIVIPEILDRLPPEDPDAQRSRRDLRRINGLMGNERWVCRTLCRFPEITERGIIEMGAGDGKLCEKIARLFPHASVTAYDLTPRPANLNPQIRWLQGDLLAMPPPESGGVRVANLFLHHFEGESLKKLGQWCQNAELLIFNEPDRAILPHVLGGIMHPWINHVTRHDMHVSITAGFAAGEISQMLALHPACWQFEETWTWRGARRVLGWRC